MFGFWGLICLNINLTGDLKLGSYGGKEALQLVKEEGQRIGLDLTNLENVNALKIEILLNHKDQRIKRDGRLNKSK